MAIDKVRERHENWLGFGTFVVLCIWLAVVIGVGVYKHQPWIEISRDMFVPAVLMPSVAPSFLPPRVFFFLTWAFLSCGLWLEAQGFRAGFGFYKAFGHYGWLFLGLWLVCFVVTALILVTGLTRSRERIAT